MIFQHQNTLNQLLPWLRPKPRWRNLQRCPLPKNPIPALRPSVWSRLKGRKRESGCCAVWCFGPLDLAWESSLLMYTMHRNHSGREKRCGIEGQSKELREGSCQRRPMENSWNRKGRIFGWRMLKRIWQCLQCHAAETNASPCLWNQLPSSLCQPHSSHSVSDFPVHAPATSSYPLNLPLSPSITPSLFHSRLKTYLFHKSFPP